MCLNPVDSLISFMLSWRRCSIQVAFINVRFFFPQFNWNIWFIVHIFSPIRPFLWFFFFFCNLQRARIFCCTWNCLNVTIFIFVYSDNVRITSKRGKNLEIRYEPQGNKCSYHVLTPSVCCHARCNKWNLFVLYIVFCSFFNSRCHWCRPIHWSQLL